MTRIVPLSRSAIVIPRARQSPGGATLPLPTLIAPILDKCHTGVIQIVGPPLSGKTTALSHLRAIFSTTNRVVFLDEPNFDQWILAKNSIAIAATQVPKTLLAIATLYLAEWDLDDWIAYLAATHRQQLQSVLRVRKMRCPPHVRVSRVDPHRAG